MQLIQSLQNYTPWNDQESRDREEILKRLEKGESLFTRENTLAHLTASGWVVNPNHTKVLLAYHNLFDSWAWLGGHADGETNLLSVAIKEVQEESGLSEIRVVSPEIYSLEILAVNGHEKRGNYVSSHLHFNLTYLLEADPAHALRCKPDENSRVAWFSLEDAVKASREPWFRDNIYPKLNAKLKSYPCRDFSKM